MFLKRKQKEFNKLRRKYKLVRQNSNLIKFCGQNNSFCVLHASSIDSEHKVCVIQNLKYHL